MPTALLLDDDHLRGRALQRKLRALGYNVAWATTYHEACDALSASADVRPFDLASLDFNLGGAESGLDVACYIVSMPAAVRPKAVEIHSNDDAGAELMLRTLTGAGVSAARKEIA